MIFANSASSIVESLSSQSYEIARLEDKLRTLNIETNNQVVKDICESMQDSLVAVVNFMDEIIHCDPDRTASTDIIKLAQLVQKNLFDARQGLSQIILEHPDSQANRNQDYETNISNVFMELKEIYREFIEPEFQALEKLNLPLSNFFETIGSEGVVEEFHKSLVCSSLRYFSTNNPTNYEAIIEFICNRSSSSIFFRQYSQILDQTVLHGYMDQLNDLYQSCFDSEEFREKADLVYKDFTKDGANNDLQISTDFENFYKRIAIIDPSLTLDDVKEAITNEATAKNLLNRLINEFQYHADKNQLSDFVELVLTIQYLSIKHSSIVQPLTGCSIDAIQQLQTLKRNDVDLANIENLRKVYNMAEDIIGHGDTINLEAVDDLILQNSNLSSETIGLAQALRKERYDRLDFSNPDYAVNKIIAKYKLILIKATKVNHNEDAPTDPIADIFRQVMTPLNNQPLTNLIRNIVTVTLGQNSINKQEASELIYILSRGLVVPEQTLARIFNLIGEPNPQSSSS